MNSMCKNPPTLALSLSLLSFHSSLTSLLFLISPLFTSAGRSYFTFVQLYCSPFGAGASSIFNDFFNSFHHFCYYCHITSLGKGRHFLGCSRRIIRTPRHFSTCRELVVSFRPTCPSLRLPWKCFTCIV